MRSYRSTSGFSNGSYDGLRVVRNKGRGLELLQWVLEELFVTSMQWLNLYKTDRHQISWHIKYLTNLIDWIDPRRTPNKDRQPIREILTIVCDQLERQGVRCIVQEETVY
jgi:hypothetical protein